MSLAVKTRTSWPVSLYEAKRHLRVEEDFTDDDDYIQNLIYAATQIAENYIGKDIAETSNVQRLFDFCGQYLNIPKGNFIEFTQGIIEDSSTLVSAIDTQIFNNYAYIKLNSSVSTGEFTPFTIYYKTGYAELNVPESIKQAVLIKIADLYDVDRQSANISSLRETKAFENLLNAYRKVFF